MLDISDFRGTKYNDIGLITINLLDLSIFKVIPKRQVIMLFT